MNAALVCLALYFGWAIGAQLQAYRNEGAGTIETAASAAVARDSQGPANKPRLDDYRVIWGRNLFATASETLWESAQEPVNEVPLAGKDAGMKLIGTAVTPNPASSYAVIDRTGTSEQGIFKARDKVGKATILAIQRNIVIIETETGERLRLSIDEEPGKSPTGISVMQASVPGPEVDGLIPPDPIG